MPAPRQQMPRPRAGAQRPLVGAVLAFCMIAAAAPGQGFTAPAAPPRRAALASAVVAGLPLAVAVQPAFAVREGFSETPSGLQYKVVKEGTGAKPKKGEKIAADYTGWLDDFESEKKFDSSRDRRKPLEFPVGVGKVIKGWDEALLDMQVGERRQIIVPPQIGYGSKAVGPLPPSSTLYFDVEMRAITR
uniref:peptidylprolyl isomerase n=1 Tax=Alexandrium monilatum TaxID=311494 RepID=A0A7S4QNX1_9DINO